MDNVASDHYKTIYSSLHEMYILARKNKALLIFLNNLKMSKKDEDFFLVPENVTFNDLMNNIILFQKDRNEIIVSVVKSNTIFPDYVFTFNKERTLMISEKYISYN
jgi:hypothetical protein